VPDETFDVVVAGFGFAGGISALNAAKSGAKTLLLEKSTQPGGLSICSYGAVRSASDPSKAFQYLKATNDGRTPDDVVHALAQGMCDIERYVRELAEINGAPSRDQAPVPEGSNAPYIHEQRPQRRNSGNYPLPGTDTFYHTTVEAVPGFDARHTYPWANGAPDGPKLFKIVHDNLLEHGVEIRLATPVQRLIADPRTREVRGVRIRATAESAMFSRAAAWCGHRRFRGDAGMRSSSSRQAHPQRRGGSNSETAFAWLSTWAPRSGTCGTSRSLRLPPQRSELSLCHPSQAFPDWFPCRPRQAEDAMDPGGPGRRTIHVRAAALHAGYRGAADAILRSRQAALPRNPAFMICDDDGRRMFPSAS
jgi:hypothetical protein